MEKPKFLRRLNKILDDELSVRKSIEFEQFLLEDEQAQKKFKEYQLTQACLKTLPKLSMPKSVGEKVSFRLKSLQNTKELWSTLESDELDRPSEQYAHNLEMKLEEEQAFQYLVDSNDQNASHMHQELDVVEESHQKLSDIVGNLPLVHFLPELKHKIWKKVHQVNAKLSADHSTNPTYQQVMNSDFKTEGQKRNWRPKVQNEKYVVENRSFINRFTIGSSALIAVLLIFLVQTMHSIQSMSDYHSEPIVRNSKPNLSKEVNPIIVDSNRDKTNNNTIASNSEIKRDDQNNLINPNQNDPAKSDQLNKMIANSVENKLENQNVASNQNAKKDETIENQQEKRIPLDFLLEYIRDNRLEELNGKTIAIETNDPERMYDRLHIVLLASGLPVAFEKNQMNESTSEYRFNLNLGRDRLVTILTTLVQKGRIDPLAERTVVFREAALPVKDGLNKSNGRNIVEVDRIELNRGALAFPNNDENQDQTNQFDRSKKRNKQRLSNQSNNNEQASDNKSAKESKSETENVEKDLLSIQFVIRKSN